MKTFIKLLLLAAVALPSWVTIAAQSLVTPPDGAAKEDWKLVSAWYTNIGTIENPTFDPTESFGRNTVGVIIVNDQMYIQGLCKALPESWVVGDIIGSTVTFAKNQWFGNGVNGAPHYLVGEGTMDNQGTIHEGVAVDVVMNYDATNKILTMSNSSLYVLDCDRVDGLVVESSQVGVDNTISSWGYHEGLEIYQPAVKQMKTLSKEDLQGVTYTWPITNTDAVNTAAGRVANVLDPVTVTDAESAAKAIALIQKIYSDPQFPGPYTRGYTTAGVPEGTVSYQAVGEINSSHQFTPNYGWRIPNKNAIKNSGSNYWFDPTDYRPTTEGYTTLLIEVQDDFEFDETWYDSTYGGYGGYNLTHGSAYENLLYYFQHTIKRVTLLTESVRTGNNLTSGTLYKIDANEINRFYLISKGQSRFDINNTSRAENGLPYYRNSSYRDYNSEIMFYHMFEQFSPTLGTGVQASKKDIYNQLVSADPMGEQKTGFPVFHDCIAVPYANLSNGVGAGGHEFQMAEEGSSATYDMRDMLFFVPDRRMTNHSGWRYVSPFNGQTTNVGSRDGDGGDNSTNFFNYCEQYAPRMDMYVIHLYEIEGRQLTDDQNNELQIYQLNLNWASNMSNFLPGEQQVYYLWRKVTDANGSTTFERVMKWTKDAQGNWVETDEPVVIQGIFGKFTLDFADHINMNQTGQLVTYYVQGQDVTYVDGEARHFLELQNSNQQSYAVPGYDKSVRMSLKIDSDYYSKFVVNEEKNNYYNEVVVSNNYGTEVTANYLQAGDNATVIYFQRFDNSINETVSGDVVEKEPTIVAKATVTNKNVTTGTITVSMEYLNQETFTGAKTGTTNQPGTFTFRFERNNPLGRLDFGTNAQGESTFRFYDNFRANVSKNEHPNLYIYRAFFESAESFPLENGTEEMSNKVYSNLKPVVIHQTEPSVGGAFTLDNVLIDSDMSQKLPESPTYSISLEPASRGEFYGYQVCHWEDKESATIPSEIGENVTGFYGKAQNQGDSYSLHFGKNPEFSEDQSGPTGTFKDLELQANGGAYYYAPQAVDMNENSYGAPRMVNAVGKLELVPFEPDGSDLDLAQMSEYKWFMNGKWYSYYNLMFNFKTLDVPEGYELYKVRAWRKVNNGANILGEEIETRAARAEVGDGWYMYEDMNFGDPLELDGTKKMSRASLHPGISPNDGELLGHRSTKIEKPLNPDGTGGGSVFTPDNTPNPNAGEGVVVEDLVNNEMRATFGALRMKTATDNSGSLDEDLVAEFKVRAYFTKNSNPLITHNSGYEPIYVVGADGSGWDFSTPLMTLYSIDGTTYEGTFTVPDAGDGNGYFSFTNQLGANPDEIWNHRFGVQWNDGDAAISMGTTYNLICWGGGTKAIKIPADTYKIKITNYTSGTYYDGQSVGNIVVTKARSAQAPRRAGEIESPYDFDYYIAEGTATYQLKKGSNIITGIGAVKMDVNREVVGVTYVNTIGQVSSTPWQGVNMVVTRYSDGSTTTRKVIR